MEPSVPLMGPEDNWVIGFRALVISFLPRPVSFRVFRVYRGFRECRGCKGFRVTLTLASSQVTNNNIWGK
jgi:hypothetical protein